MKTRAIALLCLFMGIGTSAVYAQLPPFIPEGTKSIITDYFYPDWEVVVTCNERPRVLMVSLGFRMTSDFLKVYTLRIPI